ncbi:MAG: amino acid adenylation domain-containing protein [Chloroflexota bacterium]|nr:amino acid adenylation domain-containing protein [Chloroflexota bacterium]
MTIRLEPSASNDIDFDPFSGPQLALTVPATESQREIWTATQMGPEASCAFNESNTLRLVGALDVQSLRASFADLTDRHEALRSTFTPDGSTVLVSESIAADVPLLDLSDLPAVARQARIEKMLGREVEEPFDIEQGPLIRARLIRVSAEEHLFVFTAHHLVCDGWSTGVLLRDLATLYSARHAGRAAHLPDVYPFSAYAQERLEAELTPDYAQAEDWWVSQFTGKAPGLDLPFDRTRPAFKTYTSERIDFTLNADLVVELKRLATRSASSFFTVLLAGFDVLLHRLTQTEDIVVGIPSAGQASSGHMQLVGHCVNTLPIRCQVNGTDRFLDLVGRIRSSVLDATERSDYTFGRLVRKLALPRDPSRLPLVSVLFNLDQEIRSSDLEFRGLHSSFASNPRHFENFDLFVNAVEVDGAIRLECQYNTDLLEAQTVLRWLGALELLLTAAAKTPEQAVQALPILPAADRAALATWNATRVDFPRDAQLHTLVQQTVKRCPHAVAAVFDDTHLTYDQLDGRSNQLARRLRAMGVERNVRVGLCLERSTDILVALLGVSKAGGAYVPLDPSYPVERLAFMIRDSALPVIVTQDRLRHLLPVSDAHVLSIDGNDPGITVESDGSIEPLRNASSEDVAYVIYTSGSTGTPKGVLVPHRSVVNLLACTPATPGLSETDVIVAITTLSFDIAVFDLWLPLTRGARIVVAPREAAGDGALLLGILERSRATVLQATPATWHLLVDAGWQGRPGFKAISTGEALPVALAQELTARCDDVWNMYGPTETTVWSSHYRLPKSVQSVPIGRPMGNTQLHVLDPQLQLVPVGVPGELFIGGDGVTLGYLGRAELTAERFIHDPFASSTDARLYRTGDLVRWRSDGTLDYLGRNDHQVKIRGFRIELGEIEALLTRHESVAQAVALAREDRPGDVRLVAYVVAAVGMSCSDEELRSMLRALVPEYMVPQHIVVMAALPITPNGKVDRAALPGPELSNAPDDEYVSPRNETEQILAELWQEVLGIGRIGIHDDFFQLGGHSLLAARVVSRLARDRGIALPMRSIFEAPTVARFAPLMADTREAVRIPRRTSQLPAAASIMQRRIMLLEQIDSGVRTFNLPAAWRVVGDLDVSALQSAINAFVRGQESTRTTLRWYGAQVVQTITPQLEFDLTPTDLRALPAEQRELTLMRRMLTETAEPFDLSAGPLMRAHLFRLADEEHVLLLVVHHAIWDGWSFDIFVREVDSFYRAYHRGETPQTQDLPIHYTDFADWHTEWLKSSEVADQVAYWQKQLPGDLPPLVLPTDHPRPKILGDGGATEWVDISREEVDALTTLGRREGVTLFVVLLAAFETLLHRYTGQADFLVGTPVRGRSQPELEDVVGFFVNTVVLRANLDGGPTFQELLQRVRATVLDAFSHQDVPFEYLMMSRNPAYRAFFSFQDARNRPTVLGNLTLRQVHVLPDAAANDVSMWIMENESGLIGGLNYSTELFDQPTMQHMLGSFRILLRSIVADASRSVVALPIVSGTDRAVPALEVQSHSRARLIHAEFEAHVDRSPLSLALIGHSGAVTYADLDARANGHARLLRAAGVASGQPVVLCVADENRALGLLSIAKAGGAAVPLDPSYPESWLSRIWADVGATIALLDSDLDSRVAENAGARIVLIDHRLAESERLDPITGVEDVALIAYTTGGDGHPVGVPLTHGALSRVLDGTRDIVALTHADRVVATCGSGSGRSVLELMLPLSSGAALLTVEPEAAADSQLLSEFIAQFQATALQATPSIWQALVDSNFSGGTSFVGLVSGEPLPGDTARLVAEHTGRAFGLYGQAETGFWTGVVRLDGAPPVDTGASLIGAPLPGVRWYVVDAQLEPVPPGVTGELLVGGGTLAQGYFGSPPGETSNFRLDHVAGAGGRLVRTGDLVRMRGDGRIEYRGRTDQRLLVRGLRVEPVAIERELNRQSTIAESAVAVQEKAGGARLVAWIVPTGGADYTDSELRRALRKVLPDAMVPRRYFEVAALPRTTDGQLDRLALLPRQTSLSVLGVVKPRTDSERLLADVWEEALGIPQVSVHDNFFDLGGHSLLCLQVIARIENRSGRRLNPRLLLLNTLEQVAGQLEFTATSESHSGTY